MSTPIPSNRAPLETRAAVEVTGGTLVAGRGGCAIRGVTTDSRAVLPGCAFVALRGQRQDGHAHVGAAIRAGAALVIVARGSAPADPGGADVVEVDDTLEAWGAIARAHLRRWRSASPGSRVIAITGSAGKTTTKELCAALVRSVARAHATAGNLNNLVGLPAVALELERIHRFAVLEMGMSVRGEIEALASIAEPDVGVVTNVGLAHAGGVGGGIGGVAHEKGAIYAGVAPGGVVVGNADDPAVVGQLTRRRSGATVVTFGSSDGADYRIVSRSPLGLGGSRVVVARPGGGLAAYCLPLPGGAAAMDFIAALAAAEAATGVVLPDSMVETALRGVVVPPGRMQLRPLSDDVLVLDDTYNASPATVRAALATLAEVAGGRRVAILGEMKDLGPAAEREHEALGDAVFDGGVTLLVSCGGLADCAARRAERRGVEVVFARDVDEAAAVAIACVRAGDTVLVKASRSVGAERVVASLLGAHAEREYGHTRGAH